MVPFIVAFIVALEPTLFGIISAFLTGIHLHLIKTIYLLHKDGYNIYEVLQTNSPLFEEYVKRATNNWLEVLFNVYKVNPNRLSKLSCF